MRHITVLLSVPLLSLLSSSACAGLVNGGFEQPALGYVNVGVGQTVGGWTCVYSGIEYVQATPTPSLPGLEYSAYEGSYWIDLCGTGTAGGIYQDVTGLTAGSTYRVSFAQAGNVWGANFNFSMAVLWNGVQVASFSSIHGGSNGAQMNWQQRDVDVVAAVGANRLTFRALNYSVARGAAIDAVSLTLVPAPGALALLGIAGVASVGRRRR